MKNWFSGIVIIFLHSIILCSVRRFLSAAIITPPRLAACVCLIFTVRDAFPNWPTDWVAVIWRVRTCCANHSRLPNHALSVAVMAAWRNAKTHLAVRGITAGLIDSSRDRPPPRSRSGLRMSHFPSTSVLSSPALFFTRRPVYVTLNQIVNVQRRRDVDNLAGLQVRFPPGPPMLETILQVPPNHDIHRLCWRDKMHFGTVCCVKWKWAWFNLSWVGKTIHTDGAMWAITRGVDQSTDVAHRPI